MNITEFLFSNKMLNSSDPIWLMGLVIGWGVGLIIIGMWGKKVISKEKHKALHKTLRKSGGMLKTLGIIALLLFWFRMEGFLFLSMKIWWVMYLLSCLWFCIARIRMYSRVRRRILKGKQERGEA